MTDSLSWFAIRVAPNAEFRVLHALNQQERPSLLPTEEKWITKRGGKSDKKRFPLIASYVFGGFPGSGLAAWADFATVRRLVNAASERAGKAPPIIGVVGYGKSPATLSSDEITALREISRPAGRNPSDIDLAIGQRIEIVNHPLLTGQQGAVSQIKKSGDRRMIVRAILDRLGKKVVVDLQLSNIKAA